MRIANVNETVKADLQVAEDLLAIDTGSADIIAHIVRNSMPREMFYNLGFTCPLPPKIYFPGTFKEKIED